MSILRTVARPLLASYFVYNGIDAIRRSDVHAAKLQQLLTNAEKAGVPPVLTADAKLLSTVSGLACTAAGAALAVGFWPRTNAAILAALTVPVAIINNPLTAQTDATPRKADWQQSIAATGVLGGLLFAAVDREGRPSAKWRRENARAHSQRLVASGRAKKRRRR